MARVQEQGGEDFLRMAAQALRKITAGHAGIGDRFPSIQPGGQVAMHSSSAADSWQARAGRGPAVPPGR